MKHAGRCLFHELPALRNASRAMASVASECATLLSASVASACATLLLAELEHARWDEPDSDTFPQCIHGEARARQLCMQCTVYRTWSLAPGCDEQLQRGWPLLREAMEWAKGYGTALPYCSHPDVLAVRTESAEMAFAMGLLHKGIVA